MEDLPKLDVVLLRVAGLLLFLKGWFSQIVGPINESDCNYPFPFEPNPFPFPFETLPIAGFLLEVKGFPNIVPGFPIPGPGGFWGGES